MLLALLLPGQLGSLGGGRHPSCKTAKAPPALTPELESVNSEPDIAPRACHRPVPLDHRTCKRGVSLVGGLSDTRSNVITEHIKKDRRSWTFAS